MADMIESNYAFFVGDPAWHKKGTHLTVAPATAKECAILCYGGRTLSKEPIFLEKNGVKLQIPDRVAIMRSDDEYLGSVGPDYCLLQPENSFEFFQPFVDSGYVSFETGGSLRGGTQMFALAKLNAAELEIVPGDTVKGYFLVATSFDGSLKHTIKKVITRVVCANTLAIAQGEKSDISFCSKHTKNLQQRIDAVQADIQESLDTMHKSVEQYRFLANKAMNRRQAEDYVKTVFEITEDSSTRACNIAAGVIDLIDNQKGLELVPAIRGTAWQAYNAVSEYITHEYGRNADNRLHAQYFGDTVALNRKALDIALNA